MPAKRIRSFIPLTKRGLLVIEALLPYVLIGTGNRFKLILREVGDDKQRLGMSSRMSGLLVAEKTRLYSCEALVGEISHHRILQVDC